MTTKEAQDCLKLMVGLFPGQFTKPQALNTAKEFMPFSFEAVDTAIREHRRNVKDFINWPQFWEGCRAGEHRMTVGATIANRENDWWSIQLSLHPWLTKNGHRPSKEEITLRIHRQQLHEAGHGDLREASPTHRKRIIGSCRGYLMALANELVTSPLQERVEEMQAKDPKGLAKINAAWQEDIAERTDRANRLTDLLDADPGTFREALEEIRRDANVTEGTRAFSAA